LGWWLIGLRSRKDGAAVWIAAQNPQTKAPRRLCLRAAADTLFASTGRDLPIVVVPRFSIASPRYENAELGGAHFPEHNFHCYENEFSILKLN
jgi:hypothetical protein